MPLASSVFSLSTSVLHYTRKALGILPQQRPRSYELCYEVTLKNDSSFPRSCTIILPEPQSEAHQELLCPVKVTPPAIAHKVDPIWQNKYILWQLEFLPQEEKGVEERVNVEIKPFDARFLRFSRQTTGDYSEEQRKSLFLNHLPHLLLSEEKQQQLLRGLTPQKTPIYRLLGQIQNVVCKTLTYGNPINGLYHAKDAAKENVVDCGGFSTLFVALCQACGIPARLVSGFWTVPSKHAMHAWAEALHPSGTWIPLDPSVQWLRDRKRSWRSGEIGLVGSDHAIYSHGSDITLELPDKNSFCVDLLQTPILLQEGTDIKMTHTFTSQRV